MIVLQQLINGLQLGSVYALIALGYSMVYGIILLLNFAHGDIIMVGGYIALLIIAAGISPLVAVIASVAGCTVLACLGKPLEAVHYAIAAAGAARVPVAPYRLFGTPELAEAAVETCGEGKAVLLGNHGLVVWESSLPKAFALARDLEFTAELQWRAMAVGTPNILTDGQMAEALERFKTYGQPKKQDAKNTN